MEPGVQGIMQTVSISPDDKFAVSYTNNNQIVVCSIDDDVTSMTSQHDVQLCSIVTGECRVVQKVVAVDDGDVVGVAASNRHCVVWTSARCWRCVPLCCSATECSLAVDGMQSGAVSVVATGRLAPVDKLSIVYMALVDNCERHVSRRLSARNTTWNHRGGSRQLYKKGIGTWHRRHTARNVAD